MVLTERQRSLTTGSSRTSRGQGKHNNNLAVVILSRHCNRLAAYRRRLTGQVALGIAVAVYFIISIVVVRQRQSSLAAVPSKGDALVVDETAGGLLSPTSLLLGDYTALGNRTTGGLHGQDVYPGGLHQCVTFRAPDRLGSDGVYDKMRPLLRVGLEFVEEADHFISLSTDYNSFHMFHFLEFLVIGYAELHRLEDSFGRRATSAWIYAPHFTRTEICGTRGNNCLLSSLVLNAQPGSSQLIYGMESNDESILKYCPKVMTGRYRSWLGRKTVPKPPYAPDMMERLQNQRSMLSSADAVLLINRAKCDHGPINKMWYSYLDSFPAESWWAAIQSGLGIQGGDATKTVVSYIDRQNTRRRMLGADHEWLVDYLSVRDDIIFQHLQMEKYSGETQVSLAARTDVMIGVHGNGLSYQLFMKPRSRVVEIFWKFPFQYDYSSAAQLMGHKSVTVMNGNVVDVQTIKNDPALMNWSLRLLWGRAGFTEETKQVVIELINDAGKDHKRIFT
jgi:hypothetical protein